MFKSGFNTSNVSVEVLGVVGIALSAFGFNTSNVSVEVFFVFFVHILDFVFQYIQCFG